MGFTSGLKVVELEKFGLAKRNGLEKGDVITGFDGIPVSTATELMQAFRDVPRDKKTVSIEVINVRNGVTQQVPYVMSTEAGDYQTNFGRLEIEQSPTSNSNESVLEGTLHFYSGVTAKVSGRLVGNRFSGSSAASGRTPGKLVMSKRGQMFEGKVTQNGRTFDFYALKRN